MLVQKILGEGLVQQARVKAGLVQTLEIQEQEIVAVARVQKFPSSGAFLHWEVLHPWLNSGFQPL